jgi:hypothetical protein
MKRNILLLALLCVSIFAQNPNAAVYPGAAPTDADLLVASNLYSTTLTASITATAVSIPVAAVAGIRFPAAITIDSGANAEIVKVCSASGSVLIACAGGRGFDHSASRAHALGGRVVAAPTAWMFNQHAAEIESLARTMPGGTADGQVPTWSSLHNAYVPALPVITVKSVLCSAGSHFSARGTDNSLVCSPDTPQVQTDWTAVSGLSQILHLPSAFPPSAHAASHAAGQPDAVTPAAIGAVPASAVNQPGGVLGINPDGSVSVVYTLIGPKTVAPGDDQLPVAASANNGWVTIVTDSADCITAGTGPALCRSNGAKWASIGGGGGGTKWWAAVGNPNGEVIDIAPHNMTSNTSPAPYITSTSDEEYGGHAWQAFDGVHASPWPPTDSWVTACNNSQWLQIDLGSTSAPLTGYATAAAASTLEAWTMQGSNDATTWTAIDTQTSQLGWGTTEVRTFSLSVTVGYRYYRFTANCTDGYKGFGEMYFYTSSGKPFGSGSDGDFYIDISGLGIYGPRANGVWPLRGHLSI